MTTWIYLNVIDDYLDLLKWIDEYLDLLKCNRWILGFT